MANQMAMIIGFLPTFLLSGFTFSISNMPSWLQVITYAIAPRYYVTILKEIFSEGSGLLLSLAGNPGADWNGGGWGSGWRPERSERN